MIRKRIVLRFPPRLIDQPIAYRLVKDYDLEFNILKANVTPNEEGLLVLELKGKNDHYHKGVDYLKRLGVSIQSLAQDIIRNDDKCTHCGVCVGICPTEALFVIEPSHRIEFDNDKCIACELCVPICPPRAMEINY